LACQALCRQGAPVRIKLRGLRDRGEIWGWEPGEELEADEIQEVQGGGAGSHLMPQRLPASASTT
jgi:hypothetical protein